MRQPERRPAPTNQRECACLSVVGENLTFHVRSIVFDKLRRSLPSRNSFVFLTQTRHDALDHFGSLDINGDRVIAPEEMKDRELRWGGEHVTGVIALEDVLAEIR